MGSLAIFVKTKLMIRKVTDQPERAERFWIYLLLVLMIELSAFILNAATLGSLPLLWHIFDVLIGLQGVFLLYVNSGKQVIYLVRLNILKPRGGDV